MKEYEEKAVSLALNPPKLQALANRLKAIRMTCPLFDTTRWVSLNYNFLSCKKVASLPVFLLYGKHNAK